MSRKNKRVCFSPEANDKSTIFLKDGGGGGGGGVRLSPVSFLLQLGEKMVARAMSLVSMRRSSRKVSSSTLIKSRSISDHTDSHRAEAVEDCIEFLHSSSSRERPS